MACGIYCIENKTTGKKYIGSSKNIEHRWACHVSSLKKNSHRNPHLQFAWNKYGADDFTFSIIEECLPENRLDREQAFLDSVIPLYNIANKADSPQKEKLSDEHRKKLSMAHMGVLLSDEHRRRIGEGHRGFHHSEETKRRIGELFRQRGGIPKEARDRANETKRGRHLSEEHIRKIASANRGKKRTEETKRKMSIARRGKPVSEETRNKLRIANLGKRALESTGKLISGIIKQKLRDVNIGRVGNRLGCHHSEETRVKIRTARARQVMPKGRIISKETRIRMRMSHLGHTMSEKTRMAIKIANTGNKYCLGKHLSEETRRKISEANKGRKMTDANRLKLIAVNTGKHRSKETIEKLRASGLKWWRNNKNERQSSPQN